MKPEEVLSKVEGITKRDLYYFEDKGFIKPKWVVKRRLIRREYREEDLAIIEVLWKYTQDGRTLRYAYQQAIKELNLPQDERGESLSSSFDNSTNYLDLLLQKIPENGIAPERFLAALELERVLDREYRQRGRDPPIVLNDMFEYVLSPAYSIGRSKQSTTKESSI